MPGEGVEPSRAQGPRDFESRASSNSATPANTLFHKVIRVMCQEVLMVQHKSQGDRL